ncbi:MAG: MerR family DNA-binding protein, partial [Alphaproteobacteria bacterium]|nr:MerR family DNA-binding protein [Alphaproteobacteria bacterium]
LLPKALRRGRYRVYDTTDIARVRFIRRARELGFSIDDIRALIRLSESGQTECNEARNVAAIHLARIHARIADLKQIKRVLTQTVKSCDAGLYERCPLIEALSASQ